MARVLDAIISQRAGPLSFVEAGELLWFSERHFRRLRDAFEELGEDGLIDRRRGRVSARAVDEAEAAWVAERFRAGYFVVRIRHFHEQIAGMPRASVKPRWLYQGRRERQLDAARRHAIRRDDRSQSLH